MEEKRKRKRGGVLIEKLEGGSGAWRDRGYACVYAELDAIHSRYARARRNACERSCSHAATRGHHLPNARRHVPPRCTHGKLIIVITFELCSLEGTPIPATRSTKVSTLLCKIPLHIRRNKWLHFLYVSGHDFITPRSFVAFNRPIKGTFIIARSCRIFGISFSSFIRTS